MASQATERNIVAVTRSDTHSRGQGRQDWKTWPRYQAAAEGFRGYWYPVAWSSHITGKPTAFTVCGEKIALIRDRGSVYALSDRCPHRGVPLSQGNQQFPGTLSCPYHGWTYDLSSGVLVAAITDGPDSPICGKVSVATYPVAERLGMVWLYVPHRRRGTAPDRLPAPRRARRHPVRDGGPHRRSHRQLAVRLRERL